MVWEQVFSYCQNSVNKYLAHVNTGIITSRLVALHTTIYLCQFLDIYTDGGIYLVIHQINHCTFIISFVMSCFQIFTLAYWSLGIAGVTALNYFYF